RVCPPGAIQELAYLAPLKKIRLSSTLTVKVRWVMFAIIVMTSVVLSLNLTKLLGLQDLFSLTFSLGFIAFLAIIVASTVIYRPFCRLFCPFGALSSLFSGYSILGVKRNEECVECGRCEKVCPPQVLKERAGAECYLCGRCMETCQKGALRYSKGGKKK
ncbi:MAG: 4Fe-4S binding protein, partial [Methanomassiliicoccales archaeon]|nr:4Fe-4S binding protein [Methanomassiliicoccales archaeon]